MCGHCGHLSSAAGPWVMPLGVAMDDAAVRIRAQVFTQVRAFVSLGRGTAGSRGDSEDGQAGFQSDCTIFLLFFFSFFLFFGGKK